MFPLEDFFYNVDKTRPDLFELAKTKGDCRDELESIDEMNEEERESFDSAVERYKRNNYTSSDDVKKIIIRDLLYKKMQFVNPEMLDLLDTGEAEEEGNKIYVFAQFFKPGR